MDTTMKVVAGILVFSAIAGLVGPKGDPTTYDRVNDQIQRDRNGSFQKQTDRDMGCLIAGHDVILQGLAGGC